MKRVLLFLATNIAVLLVLSITLRLVGFEGLLAENGVDLALPQLLLFAAVFGMGGSFVSLALSKFIAKRATGAQVIAQARTPGEQWLVETVRQQAKAAGIGMPLGAVAGWKGGRADFLIMRVVDVMSALPTLLFAYLIMARLGAGFWNVMLAIGVTTWISVCRLTRAQFLTLREKEFVEASRMIGANGWRIVRYHLLPNALAPIIVALTLGIPVAIFAEASLSFLGVGINPPMPSWGQMIGRDGITNMTYYWHLAFFPALMIALTMLGFTLMGDGLRDALDPQMVQPKK